MIHQAKTVIWLLFSLLLAFAAQADEQGLLWRIAGKGSESYLFATIHSDDPRVTRLPDEVQAGFGAADTLMLEMSLDAESEWYVAQQMLLAQEQSLTALVGEALGQQAQAAMSARGVPPQVTERLQPWAVVLTLSMPQQQSGQVLDLLLYQRAQAAAMHFQPLESAAEQVAVFASLSLEEQKALLRGVLEEYQDYPQLFERMIAAYLDGDLAALVAMNEAHPLSSDASLQQKMEQRLITQRNRRMVARMRPLLEQGRVFVAVGALHLPGPEGIISLLRQQGFTLTPVR
jgi:uncharacterized protein YbaP (TraB family)